MSHFIRFLNFRAHRAFAKKLKRSLPKAAATLLENFLLQNRRVAGGPSRASRTLYKDIRKYRNFKKFSLSSLLSSRLLLATFSNRFSPYVSNIHGLAVKQEFGQTFNELFSP